MKDWNGYIKRMGLAMTEKLFFIDKIDVSEYDTIVDFGCANGDLIRNLIGEAGRGTAFIGFDISEEMIRSARELNSFEDTVFFTTDITLVKEAIKHGKVLMIFSSVWHEIQPSYYPQIFDLFYDVDTIVIRDMYFDETIQNVSLSLNEYNSLRAKISNYHWDTFQKVWGDGTNEIKELYHLFLKYTYIDNWETELYEDYFGTPWDGIMEITNNFGFTPIYDRKYTLKFKESQVLKDFGYLMTLPTHRNLILRRK